MKPLFEKPLLKLAKNEITARPIPKCRCCSAPLRDEHAMLCGPCERDSELSCDQGDNQVADCDHPGLRWEGWGE